MSVDNPAIDSVYDAAHQKPLHWNEVTQLWERVEARTVISPFIDIDVSYVWNQDGTPAQKIETGLGHTKTTVYTWLNGALQSKAVILT